MHKLYIKLHPSYMSWMVNDSIYGVIEIDNDLITTGNKIYEILGEELQNIYPKEIVLEKPFLKLLGENQHKLAGDIIKVQRTFGAMLFILSQLFPDAIYNHVSAKVAREGVYKRQDLSKDTQLSEVNVLLKNIREKNYPPLALLCLHDCLVLKSYGDK